MSKTEVADFEQMLVQDPLLSSEYSFQQDIINGVKDYRKAELKMRLDHVDVTPGLFQTVAGNTAVQATSVVMLTGVIFVGSYLWVETPERIDLLDFSVSSKTFELTESRFNENLPEELPLIELGTFDASNKTDEIAMIKIEDEFEESMEIVDPIIPDVVAPELADSGLDENILPEVEESIIITSQGENNINHVEIEIVTTSKRNFRYKFYNNKLFLYGDFNGIPYEILEINNRSGKKLFLYHDSYFFRINDNVTKSSLLRQVTNADLIKELMILKENKSE